MVKQALMRNTVKFVLRKVIPSVVRWKAHDMLIYRPVIRSLGIDGRKVPLFDAVFFEVRTRCNGVCGFCAAAVQSEIREDMSMPFELYAKVIDELKEINYSGKIAYHVNSEPLLFKDLVRFVVYARKTLPDAWIQILSNGKSLRARKGEELVAAGINELSINHYVEDLAAPLPARLAEFKEKVLLKTLKPEQIKTGHGPDAGNPGVFRFNIFPSRVDAIKDSRAGTAPNKKEPDVARGFCQHPFKQFNIRADGVVSMCCADLYFSIPMGNVTHQSVMEIWNGDKFAQVRENLLKGKRDAFDTCKNCDYYGVDRPMKNGSFLQVLAYRLTNDRE